MDDVSAKIITLFVLIILTLVFGCLPYFLVLRGSRSLLSSRFRDVAFACLNTFAGGVFLGTLLLHLMIEGGEEFEDWKKDAGWDNDFPLFNVFVFAGFLIVGLVEHFMNSCMNQHNRVHSHDAEAHNNSRDGIEDRGVAVNSRERNSQFLAPINYDHILIVWKSS